MTWKAYIVEDPMADPLMRSVRLLLVDVHPSGRASYVTSSPLVLKTVEDGVALGEEAGLLIPAESVEAIRLGIERWQGKAGNPAAEVAVLREWLAVERERVDRALGCP
jgi:hypothetical protein